MPHATRVAHLTRAILADVGFASSSFFYYHETERYLFIRVRSVLSILNNRNSLASLTVGLLSALPGSLSCAQEHSSNNSDVARSEVTTPVQSLDTESLLRSLTITTDLKDVDLPERIVAIALEKGLDLATIKLEAGQWVECTEQGCTPLVAATPDEVATYGKPQIITGLRTGETLEISGHSYSRHVVESEPKYGIPGLGSFTTNADGSKTFTPYKEFKGVVRRASTTKSTTSSPSSQPQIKGAEVTTIDYSRDNLGQIRSRLVQELTTTFVLVISVPSECEPCVLYKPNIEEAARRYSDKEGVVFVVINFQSFSEARRVIGTLRLFPTTVVFPALPANTSSTDLHAANWHSKSFLSGLNRPGYKHIGNTAPGPLRELISKGLGVVDASVKTIAESLSDFLSLKPLRR